MLSWDGLGRQYRRSCAAYLEDVFELLDAAPGDPRVPVLDEVIHLLNPTAMRARMEYVPAAYPRRAALAERTRVSVSLLNAEPATTAQLTRQLRELRASGFGRWLRPSGQGQAAGIDLGRAVTERAVVLFRLAGPGPGTRAASSAMLTRLVCQDLLAAGAALSAIDVEGDGIIWLAECGSLPRQAVTDLIARGPGTGVPVLAATTSPQAAAELAELTNVVVAHRMTDAATARQLAAAVGADGPARPPGDSGDGAQLTPGPAADATPLAALRAGGVLLAVQHPQRLGRAPPPPLAAPRDGEFLLAVKHPKRLVWPAQLVRARVPLPTRDRRPAGPPRPASAGARGRERTAPPPGPPACASDGSTRRRILSPARRRAGPPRPRPNGSTRPGPWPSGGRRACCTGRLRRPSPSRGAGRES